MEHILLALSRRYPQLLFPVAAGTSKSPEYTDAVLCGKKHTGILDYSLSEKDWLRCIETSAGSVDVLFLYERKDFEKCACALANRCEPRIIPESIGAFFIRGLINWEKVRKLLNKQPEDDCFVNRFTLNWLKQSHGDYLDRIILLSSGWYSGVAPERIGLSEEAWTEKSVTIRMYHELTHFMCRSLHPENVNTIRDEVFADAIGLIAAFGHYDANIAKMFLGVDELTISENARIRYYIKNSDEGSVRKEVGFWISWLAEKLGGQPDGNIEKVIVTVFDKMLDSSPAL